MATGPPSPSGHPAARQGRPGTWTAAEGRGQKVGGAPTQPRPPAHQPWTDGLARPQPLPSPGSAGLPGSAGRARPPDRHCERKTAGHEQTRYLFSRNLWAGAAPRARERAARPAPPRASAPSSQPLAVCLPLRRRLLPQTCSLPPPPSTFLAFPISLPASASLLPKPGLCPRPPAGLLGPLRSPAVAHRSAGVLAPGRQAGPYDCGWAWAGLFLSLSLSLSL